MGDNKLDPRIEALLRGRRGDPAQTADCPEAADISRVLNSCDCVIAAIEAQFPDRAELEAELEFLQGGDCFEIPTGQKLDSLSPQAREKLSRLCPQPLMERVKKSVERLTGRTGEAARRLAEKVLASPEPAGAPAIRKDATEVSDSEPAPQDKKDPTGEDR